MQNAARSLKVGALLVAAAVGGVALYRGLFQSQGRGDTYRVHAIFNDATGLVPRSRVLTAGIPVGEIERIRLEGGMARVNVRIRSGCASTATPPSVKRAVAMPRGVPPRR
jgi:phospholipid/cholesterol/gamma-HCH transport system substrate-binding protein